jgi:N-acyl-D-amino-acid deacylase
MFLKVMHRMKEKIDLLIRNGLVFDGTGSEPFEADIGISGDMISFIKKKSRTGRHKLVMTSERIIDAKDMAVAPGFIDTHAHSEFTLLADPRAEGKICQGITTEINGNCGLSAAPLFGEAFRQREEDLREFDIRERWSTFKEYFAILMRKGISLNFMTLVGHGNVRACIAGYKDKKLTTAENTKMCTLLKKSLQEGAIGLSTGLIYPPGVYSDTEELIDLCKAMQMYKKSSIIKFPHPPFSKGERGGITGDMDGLGIYTSHMRSEGERLIESIKEIITIGRKSHIKVHISHIKTSGEKNWHKIDDAISKMGEAQNEGIRITCDRYPYTAASTDLDTVLPSWVYEGGAEAEIKRLKNPGLQEKIKKEILYEHPERDYWEKIYVSSVINEKNRWMEGKSVAYIAGKRGSEAVDTLIGLLIGEKLRVGAIFSSMSEENLRKFLALPYVMIGTDSSARSAIGSTCKGKPHPRGFGSFPRFLGMYVRDSSLVSMSEAIRKVTMLPAGTFGIHKRGILKRGAFADIVVFDRREIIDRATFDEPFLRPEGIHTVVVNGKVAVSEGRLTGDRAGRVLKHGR